MFNPAAEEARLEELVKLTAYIHALEDSEYSERDYILAVANLEYFREEMLEAMC